MIAEVQYLYSLEGGICIRDGVKSYSGQVELRSAEISSESMSIFDGWEFAVWQDTMWQFVRYAVLKDEQIQNRS